MSYEVEMKFPVADPSALERRLADLGASPSAGQSEEDVYFAHPARDFAQTDEALRIRRRGSDNFLAYKGPKIDPTTKTRHEIDLELPPGEASARAWTDLLTVLGFTPVGEVRKRRRKAQVDWKGGPIEISLDEVEWLGHFVELELIAERDDIESAKERIASLAEKLELERSERRSYLELSLRGV